MWLVWCSVDSFVGSEEFIGCDNFDKLMRQLQQRNNMDVFNIFILQKLVACFNNHELTEVIEAYYQKKESNSQADDNCSIPTCYCQQGEAYSNKWNGCGDHQGSKENNCTSSNSQRYWGTSNGRIRGMSQEIHSPTCRIRLHNHILGLPQGVE